MHHLTRTTVENILMCIFKVSVTLKERQLNPRKEEILNTTLFYRNLHWPAHVNLKYDHIKRITQFTQSDNKNFRQYVK